MNRLKERAKDLIILCIITAKEFMKNELFYMANALTYKMIIAFFTVLISLLSLFAFINDDTTVLLGNIIAELPETFALTIEKYVENAALSNTIFSVSILYGIWSATRGFHAIIKGMNRCSAVEETRNFIVLWLCSFVLVFIFIAYILISLVFVVYDEQLKAFLGLIPVLSRLLFILDKLPLNIMNGVLTCALVLIFYEFTAARKFKFTELLPGAVFTITAWIILSVGLSFYMKINTNAFHVYGSISGVFVTIFWVNMLASTLLAGAQLNAVILDYERLKDKYITIKEQI
ncbi:MAG: YihY/virulence factor BrkB family protein [Eubacterium sp.]|nr:YihY/virulence factor BrkB family protein [Eubacterium sp.]